MKKIMFNDKYGLTEAVLEGRKTMTRRFAKKVLVEDADGNLRWNGQFEQPKYKVCDIVAVAQSYKDTKNYPPSFIIDEFHPNIEYEAGWCNKMFVLAELMPHQIRITNVRVERLQDISDEDCIKEGLLAGPEDVEPRMYGFQNGNHKEGFFTPREAFSALIDKVSGKGTFKNNPWVYVYEFELVK